MSFAKFSGRGFSAAKTDEDAKAARRMNRDRFRITRNYGLREGILSVEIA
jgi:hypothetical protein